MSVDNIILADRKRKIMQIRSSSILPLSHMQFVKQICSFLPYDNGYDMKIRVSGGYEEEN